MMSTKSTLGAILATGSNLIFALPTITTMLLDESIEHAIQCWPAESRQQAGVLIQRHGHPTEINGSRLLWTSVGPWREVALYRDGTLQRLPQGDQEGTSIPILVARERVQQ